MSTTLASLLVPAAICSGSMMLIFDTVLIHSLESTVLKGGHAQPIQNLDGIVSESSTSLNGSITGQNQGALPNANSALQPDDDCLFNPSLPKCAPLDGKCPPGFLMNEDEQCFPDKPCPPGFAKLDEDETGTCYPVSTPTPSLSDGDNASLAPNSTLSQ